VLALGLALAVFLLNRRPEHSSSTPVLAVAPIHQVPARRDSTEALPIADLLATSLARLPSMQVLSNARLIEIEQSLTRNGTAPPVTEIARRAQATELLGGTVYRIGTDSMVLELQRIDVRSGKVLHGYRVGASDVFTLVDRATAEIARAAAVARPAEGIADVTTRSLVAFRFYQEGLRSFYNNDLSAARRLFQSAVGEDSAFAMAMWYLGRTDGATENPAGWEHYASALRLAAGASERERWLITSSYLIADSRATARIVAESLTTRFPSDPDGLWLLGVAAAVASDYELGANMLRRAIAVDSTLEVHAGPACRLCDAYESLIYLYLSADSIATARSVAEESVRRVPASARAWAMLAHVAWAQDDSLRAFAAEAESRKLMPNVGQAEISPAVLRLLWRGDYEQGLDRMISLGSLHPGVRPDARWYAVIALRNLGRLREALDLSWGRVPGNEPRAVLNVAVDTLLPTLVRFEQGDARPCVALFARPGRRRDPTFRMQWPGHAAREEAWEWARLAMCRAEARDTGSLAAIADTLQRLGAISGYGRNQRLHHYVRGLLWKARGNEEEAAAEFRAAISSPNLGFTRINYELGKALLSLQRPVEAVAILQPALRGDLDASNLYVTRTEIHELLAMAWERAGRADSAGAHWGAVEGAWRHADPQFRARYEFARARLATGAGR
jgi:tetratricopeptide (TPR) repeat protein